VAKPPRVAMRHTRAFEARYYKEVVSMEVRFSPDKEARLQQFAARAGKEPSQLVEEAVDRMLEYDARFIEAVEVGREAARRGDLLEHDEVVESIERNFRS
jgi:predicted transcriptional regulator